MKFVEENGKVPRGLSRYAKGFRFRFPVWVREGRGYMVHDDLFAYGRWVREVCIRFEGWRVSVHSGEQCTRVDHRIYKSNNPAFNIQSPEWFNNAQNAANQYANLDVTAQQLNPWNWK